MKKLLLFFVFVVGSLFLVACSISSGPEAIAKKAIVAIQKGDYDAYVATLNISPSDQKILAGIAEEKIAKNISDKGGIKSFKITDSTINGDSATVRVHLVYKDASEEDRVMDFTKVDGEWKQVMNK